MNTNDIIFAKTIVRQPGVCDVTYCDGTTDVVWRGIGDLYDLLTLISNRGRYLMIGRSSLICENNIVMINPSKGKLVLAFDSLGKRHQMLEFSDNLLRELRGNFLYNNK